MVTFVSFGASLNLAEFIYAVDSFKASDILDGKQLMISGGLFLLSIAIARTVQRRQKQKNGAVT